MDTASDFDSIFFARAWCCCWFVVRWFKVYSRCQIMAAADFFFLSERTNSLFFIQISNKFRENPSSPSAVRVVVDTKYNTHTHSINNTTTTTTTCRTTKVAVPLLMSTSTTIYSPAQTCVLFNVIVSRVNSRFCSCCVCWYFSFYNNEPEHHHHHHLHH